MTALVLDAPRSLSIGDLVTFNFPYANSPKFKNRVCLVIHEDLDTDEIVLAYGTTNLSKQFPGDFCLKIADNQAANSLGLRRASQFFFGRRIRVCRDDPRFTLEPSLGTARIGSMAVNSRRQISAKYYALPSASPSAERQGVHKIPPVIQRRQLRGPWARRPGLSLNS